MNKVIARPRYVCPDIYAYTEINNIAIEVKIIFMFSDILICEVKVMNNIEKIEAVQKMQDYISRHLREVITLKDLARAACYSPYYASRIFKELIGKNLFEYLRSMRLTQAAILMRDHKVKVIDVAFDFVFDSHEGFTRAFTKEFGLPPKTYQETTPPIRLFLPYSIRDYYHTFAKQKKGENQEMNEKNHTVFVQVVERPTRKAIIRRGIKADNYFDYCNEVGCDVWGLLLSVKEALYEPVGMWLPEKMVRPGTSSYVQGVEVPADYDGNVPEGFEIISLTPCKMMIFQGEPFKDEEFEEAIGNLWEVMDRYDPLLYGFVYDDDAAPRFQMEPQGYRGYIEGRPVKQLNK
jgi:AraC-like DNA-binding protein